MGSQRRFQSKLPIVRPTQDQGQAGALCILYESLAHEHMTMFANHAPQFHQEPLTALGHHSDFQFGHDSPRNPASTDDVLPCANVPYSRPFHKRCRGTQI